MELLHGKVDFLAIRTVNVSTHMYAVTPNLYFERVAVEFIKDSFNIYNDVSVSNTTLNAGLHI